MKKRKYLHHEISNRCNYKQKHVRCPIHSCDIYALKDTSRVMDNETILDNISTAYELGFDGWLSWVFYNEPLLELGRLEEIAEGIQQINPNARNLLWTNGALIGTEIHPERLSIFTDIVISNYERRDWSWLRDFRKGVTILRGHLDWRMRPTEETIRTGCTNPQGELFLDYYGNWRLCCKDYLGSAVNVNVHDVGFRTLVEEANRMNEYVSRTPQPEDAPDICLHCRLRR